MVDVMYTLTCDRCRLRKLRHPCASIRTTAKEQGWTRQRDKGNGEMQDVCPGCRARIKAGLS